MTWRFGVGQPSLQQWVATCLAFSAMLGACGDDDAPTKSLVVTDPTADAELSMADDTDTAADGLQYDVMIATTGLAVGTELRVLISEGDQEKQVGNAEVGADGTATATGVTLDPGQKSIYAKTENAEITSDATQSYTFRMLEITSPVAGTIDADADASMAGTQVNVSVAAYAVTGDLTLAVDGTELAGSATIADGVATFGVTLEAGSHTLVAKAGDLESAAVEVTVMRQCGSLVLISPRASSDGRLVLGGSDNTCPTDGSDYTSTFEVSTDIGDDLPARLFVNGSMVKSAMVDQTLATFEDVVLDSRAMASAVRVEIDAPEGTCSRTFDLELFVDCAGPGCTIVSPTPFQVTEGTATTNYLNRAMGNGEYTVEVSSDMEVIGRDIELIVDGNTANPLTMQAADDSGSALATFEDVALADGNHSVRARCTDVNGNVTMSAEASWMVDTTPCSVAISSPSGNTSIYTDDDTNGSVAGTQYAVSATVTGGDCENARAAECNSANGIADGAFSTFVDGADFEVTLSTALTSQSLCVEVQDRAGNIGLGAVQVDHYDETRPIPDCAIVSPTPYEAADGVEYLNAADSAGGGMFTVEVASSASTIGQATELVIDGNANPVSATAVVDGAGAKATFAVLLPDGDHSLVARCTAPGGVPRLSEQEDWKVDTTPCTVALTSPAANTKVFFDDDTDSVTADVQTVLRAMATGGGCIDARAMPCDPSAGIAGGSFAPYTDGDPITVTLEPEVETQELCVEYRDQAGNIGLGSVAIESPQTNRPIPNCAIVSPTPYVNGGEYLNSDAGNGDGTFTVEVDTSDAVAGVSNGVELVVTGGTTQRLFADASASGPGAKAIFTVTMPDGPYAVLANCTDSDGTPSSSDTENWIVDTAACQVAVTSPASGTKVFLDDDVELSTAGVVDTMITANSTGASCNDVRVASCDTAAGIAAGSFSTFTDGAPMTVALADTVTTQDLCVEIRDQAGNIGLGSVAIESPQTNRPIPNCAIVSPTPYVNGGEYLNSDAGNGTFSVQVDTVAEAAGLEVELVVDGNTASTLSATAVAGGGGASATFALSLSEGAHTVVANCVDDNGTPSTSVQRDWTVDTQGCGVQVTSPVAGAKFILADDTDGGAAGTQVLVDATVTGAGCEAARAVPCDGIAIAAGSFGAFAPGDQVPATLDPDNAAQNLCLEVRDVAGNVTIDSVAIEHFSRVPMLSVLSPADGTLYNTTGDDGQGKVFEVDEDLGTPACQSTFTVACSEIGLPVELVRQPSNGVSAETVLGSVLCGAGGQAIFSQISFQDLADPDATFEARQTYPADSGDQVGTSTAINLDGQCESLVLTYAAAARTASDVTPLTSCPSRLGTTGVTLDVTVTALPVVAATSVLTVLDANGADVTIGGNELYRTNGDFRYVDAGVTVGSTIGMALVTVTVTDDFNNTSVSLCDYSVSDSNLALAMAVATPPGTTNFTAATANNAACPNNGTGQFQVPFVLTIDGDSTADPGNRTLSYSVDGGSDIAVPVANAGQVVCADVPEGSSTIAAVLADTLSSDLDGQQFAVTVDTVSVTSPVAGDKYAGPNGAGCTGNQGLVSASFHSIYPDGEPVTVQTGLSTNNPTIQDGAISLCVGLAPGSQSITVTVPSTGATETVDNVTFLDSPVSETVEFVAALPSSAYRTTPLDVTWTLPSGGTYEFVDYDFRCKTEELNSSDPATKTNWWTSADAEMFVDGTTSRFSATGTDATAGTLELATGGVELHCVLRLLDAAGRRTGIPDTSVAVSKPFRSEHVDGLVAGAALGSRVHAVGDVNGDGYADALLAAPGTADPSVHLYFGSASGTPNSQLGTTIHNTAGGGLPFGNESIAALGDFNGDGRSDFAIGAFVAGGGTGVVYVFYGRDAADPWPTSIDVGADDNGVGCDADLCITHSNAGINGFFLGYRLSGVGNFDGAGPMDLAISSPQTDTLGAMYIVLGKAFDTCGAGVCARPGSQETWGRTITLDPELTTSVDGFYIAPGRGTATLPAGSPRGFGEEMVAVGRTGGAGDSTDDMVVNAYSGAGGDVHPIFLVPGRTHPGGGQLVLIDFVDAEQIYAGNENFARGLFALGNVFDPDNGTGTMTGMPDLAVFSKSGSGVHIFPGDSADAAGFSATGSQLFYVGGPAGSGMGTNTCAGQLPALPGLDLDLDGDGIPDTCVGSTQADGLSAPGGVHLFPGDTLLANTLNGGSVGGSPILYQHALDFVSTAGDITPGTSTVLATETAARVPQIIGDLTGDGVPDIIVGDVPAGGASDAAGGFWILY